ncbi:MAG: hypothetical protein KDA68_10165 [Planctomycetaceae bacterium]|nr:hypothetical protein [Planctomycetaceae bacterium]
MVDVELSEAEMPPRLTEFRRKYRSNVIGPMYNGYAHLAFVVTGSTLVMVAAALQIRNPHWTDWICIPVTFIVANFVEYFGHRGPMHHYFKQFGLMFHRHTNEHHQFFTENWMTCRSQRDFKIVLFPPIMLFFYLGIIAAPMGLFLYYMHGWNFAMIYVITAMFYFMSYEVMHFFYHLDDDLWVSKLPILRVLRAHHRTHHKLEIMSKYNFNITWPIADFVMGTIYREPKGKKSAPSESAKELQTTEERGS